MKKIPPLVVSAMLAIVTAVPASAATTDPEIIIYRFPGVRETNVGTSTVFFCTNFSGVAETLRLVTRNFDTTLLSNIAVTIPHLATKRASTGGVNAYGVDNNLTTGFVDGGTTAIAATSTNIICTAITIDGANTKPVGVPLRGIRFSPVPGSQE